MRPSGAEHSVFYDDDDGGGGGGGDFDYSGHRHLYRPALHFLIDGCE